MTPNNNTNQQQQMQPPSSSSTSSSSSQQQQQLQPQPQQPQSHSSYHHHPHHQNNPMASNISTQQQQQQQPHQHHQQQQQYNSNHNNNNYPNHHNMLHPHQQQQQQQQLPNNSNTSHHHHHHANYQHHHPQQQQQPPTSQKLTNLPSLSNLMKQSQQLQQMHHKQHMVRQQLQQMRSQQQQQQQQQHSGNVNINAMGSLSSSSASASSNNHNSIASSSSGGGGNQVSASQQPQQHQTAASSANAASSSSSSTSGIQIRRLRESLDSSLSTRRRQQQVAFQQQQREKLLQQNAAASLSSSSSSVPVSAQNNATAAVGGSSSSVAAKHAQNTARNALNASHYNVTSGATPNTVSHNSPAPQDPMRAATITTDHDVKAPKQYSDAMDLDEDTTTTVQHDTNDMDVDDQMEDDTASTTSTNSEDSSSSVDSTASSDPLRHWARLPIVGGGLGSTVIRFLYKKDPRPVIRRKIQLLSTKKQFFDVRKQNGAFQVRIAEKHPFLTIKGSIALQPRESHAYYFEIRIVHGGGLRKDNRAPGPSPHVRVGFVTPDADDRVPVGYCENGISYRDVDGSAVHCSKRTSYGESFSAGDVIGCLLYLPETEKQHEQPILQVDSKDRQVEQNGETFEFIMEILKKDKIPNSCAVFYKNGKCQGVACSSLRRSLWYPAVSLYMGAEVELNLGGKPFAHLPQNVDATLLGSNASSGAASDSIKVIPVNDMKNFNYHETFVQSKLSKRLSKYKSKLEQNILPAKRKSFGSAAGGGAQRQLKKPRLEGPAQNDAAASVSQQQQKQLQQQRENYKAIFQ